MPLNLSNANLEMVNLPHADLRGANLTGANLRGAMLWGALLDHARLDGAEFTCANLTWCSLLCCSMLGTLLVEADLDEATVDPSLENANTTDADMVSVNYLLQGWVEQQKAAGKAPWKVMEEVVHEHEAPMFTGEDLLKPHTLNAPESLPRSLRMRGAKGFELSRSDPALAGDWYEYKCAQLKQAQTRILSDSDLWDLLDWSAATGKPLNLRGCNLSGANLRNATLDGACLAFANFTGTDTRGASLIGADLDESYGWPK